MTPAAAPVVRSPGRGLRRPRPGDAWFQRGLTGVGLSVVAVTAVLTWQLAVNSALTWKQFGWSFLWSSTWDPVREVYGALPFIYGTAVSSGLALLLAVPIGVGCAIFLVELAPKRVAEICAFIIELLAAVPSVILGLMGIFVLVPVVRAVEPGLTAGLGWLPLFQGEPYGVGMLTAGLILSLMVLPYITVISREVLLAVPRSLKEAMLALGATRWETVMKVSLPYARPGIAGAVFLALGRALGETMAVTMVIGNTPQIKASLLAPGYSMASVIANELAEASSDEHLHSLIAIGLVLLGISLVVNAAARAMIGLLERRA
ncbi:MAG: phosphate ABC transporter permease subunit PstC [Elusimicrobia bacterium]|nr:phosphate ABC transporter permease subunit PstC [Elusimicrobiota bacterium]